MAIRIVTDSAADYSAQEIERRKITCIPMAISFGEEQYLDGVDITKEEFYEKLTSSEEFPKTSQPAPTAFINCFEEAKAAGDTVIAVLISGALSGTIQSALLAKDMVEYENIYIIDSKTATLGMRMLVDRAVILREKGMPAEQIVAELEALKSRVSLYAGLDTLEYLYKGGRLSKSQASIGNLVNLKPLITISEEGTVELFGKQIGIRHAYKQLAKTVEEAAPDPDYPVYFLYSYDKKNCAGFIQYLQKKGMEFGAPKIRGIGPTIGSHIGVGAFAIVYVKKAQ
ncbi:MAG: DegV family protein [Eubacteriales bacterium]|nr:DegV family protein [Eubacteriales bacterium]